MIKQTIEEKIRQRRSQMLIHSCLYYEMDESVIDDHTWQRWADELAELRLIVAEDHEQAREEREELRRATIGIANLLASLDSDRPTILRKLNSIENKLDRFLERRDGENADG